MEELEDIKEAGKILKLAYKLVSAIYNAPDKVMSQKVANSVKYHAIAGGVCAMIPTVGVFIFLVALWHMYYDVCTCAKISFKENFWKCALSAIVVNFLIAFLLGYTIGLIPVAGWFVDGIVAFIQIIVSGCIYLKALTIVYGDKAKEKTNFANLFSNEGTGNKKPNAPTTSKDVFQQVCTAIASKLNVNPGSISADSSLADLGVQDSNKEQFISEVLFATGGIQIEGKSPEVSKVADLVNYIISNKR